MLLLMAVFAEHRRSAGVTTLITATAGESEFRTLATARQQANR